MSDHPTQQVNAVEVLSRLIDGVQKSVDRGNAEVGTLRDEVRTIHGEVGAIKDKVGTIEGSVGELKRSDSNLADNFVKLADEVKSLTRRVEVIEDARTTDKADRSTERHERHKEREAMISHVSKLEKALHSVEDTAKETKGDVSKTNEAVGAIVEELGIEDKVELGREVKPGEAKPVPTFQRIEKRAKHSTIVQAVIAIGVIVDAILRLSAHH